MLLFRLLAWPTLLFSSRTWDLQWNAVVQLIPTGWGRKLPEIWGNETYQPAIASCDATEYEYLSVCPIDKLVKHPYLHLTCQVAKYPIWKIQTYHLNLPFGELDPFQWLRGNRPSPHPPPQLFGHSKRHVALQLASTRWSSSLPPAGTAPASVCGFGRYTCCPGAATSSDIKRWGVCRKAALWPLKQICWFFFLAIWVSLQLVEINDNLVTQKSTNGFSIATTRYIVWSDFLEITFNKIPWNDLSSTFFHTSNREVYFYCLLLALLVLPELRSIFKGSTRLPGSSITFQLGSLGPTRTIHRKYKYDLWTYWHWKYLTYLHLDLQPHPT